MSFQSAGSSGTPLVAHEPSPPFDAGPRFVNQNAGLWPLR